MRDYKVGDTIYVKGKITDVDHNETMLPYCVVSSPNYHFWASQESVLDELPTSEPVKPVLPKDVADELEKAKTNNLNFYGYMDHIATNQFTKTKNHIGMLTSYTIELLFYAWHNGYTVEKEPKYLVKVPTSWNNSSFQQYFQLHGKDMIQAPKDIATEFTNEELKKYELDKFEKELVTDDSED